MNSQTLHAVLSNIGNWQYAILLRNNSNNNYLRINVLTGAFQSVDGGVLESSKALHDFGALAPGEGIRISTTDIYELDMVVWFNVDAYKTAEGAPEQYYFSLPRRNLPEFETPIELRPAQREPLDVLVTKIDMTGGWAATSRVP